ncbi:MAG: phage major capsid protein [Gammaproteobacteria bacterium]|nr:phage major capsid protein [Gammaproteobacteria bacterium]
MTETVCREITIDHTRADDETRTVEASLSSDTLVERDFGFERLSHDAGAVDLTRAEGGLPLLFSHNPDEPIGAVDRIKIAGGKLRGVLRFGRTQKANDIWSLVRDGLLKGVSVGYRILAMEPDGEHDNGRQIFNATRWQLLEVSAVSVPADATVGVGRSHSTSSNTLTLQRGTNSMTQSTNQDALVNDMRNKENARRETIEAIAKMYPCVEPESREAIRSGMEAESFRLIALDLIHTRQGKPTEPQDLSDSWRLGMSSREASQFSFVRAIQAQLDPRMAANAGFELECSEAIAQRLGKRPQGVYVPQDVVSHKRDLSVGTTTAGGFLKATNLLSESFIDILRNKTLVLELGATVLSDLVGDVAIPKQDGAATVAWVAEAVAASESQQTFAQVTLSPKSLSAWTEYSRKLLLQATPDIEMLVKNDLAAVIGQEIDRVVIEGSGTGSEPLGILGTAGIGDVAGGAVGAVPTLAHIVELLTDVANANADTGQLAYLTNSKVRGKLLQTEKFSGSSGSSIWESGGNGEGILLGHRAGVSNSVPSDLTKSTATGLSAILFGNWGDVLIGRWGGLDLLVDPYTNSSTGSIRIVVFTDTDVALRHVESFSAMQDAITV